MDATKMREAAEPLLPEGEWQAGMADDCHPAVWTATGREIAILGSSLEAGIRTRIAAHIAAAQPANVIALCDQLAAATARAEAAEAERDSLRLTYHEMVRIQAERPCQYNDPVTGQQCFAESLPGDIACERHAEPEDGVFESENEQLRAQLRQAREALEPFAKLLSDSKWRISIAELTDSIEHGAYYSEPLYISFADVLRAAATLTALSAEEAKDGE
jgi:hypothetical protein